MPVTTDEQDKTIAELMTRHISAVVDPSIDTNVTMRCDDGDACYLVMADGTWGRIDLDCENCGGTGTRPVPGVGGVGEPGMLMVCMCVEPDDDSGEWA